MREEQGKIDECRLGFSFSVLFFNNLDYMAPRPNYSTHRQACYSRATTWGLRTLSGPYTFGFRLLGLGPSSSAGIPIRFPSISGVLTSPSP